MEIAEKFAPTHRVKIIKATKTTYWYANMIGNEYDVVTDEEEDEKWAIVTANGTLLQNYVLDKDDTVLVCEINAPKPQDAG